MKKRVLLPVLAVSMLALAVPVLADETEGAPPAFSEEDRPELPPNVKRTDVVAVFAKPQAQPAPETMNGEPAQKAPDKPQEAPDKPQEAPDEPQEAPDQTWTGDISCSAEGIIHWMAALKKAVLSSTERRR